MNLFRRAFRYSERSSQLYRDFNEDRAIEYGEHRDQTLEQYLWTPYNHIVAVYSDYNLDARTQTIASATPTALGSGMFNANLTDDVEGAWDVASATFTCPIQGRWRLTGSVTFSVASVAGSRAGYFLMGGTGFLNGVHGPSSPFAARATTLNFSATRLLNVGDTIQLAVEHYAGAPLNATSLFFSPFFMAEFVGVRTGVTG